MSKETIQKDLTVEKEKIKKIITGFEDYHLKNYESWDKAETEIAQQILGTLILTFKKVEKIEQLLPHTTDEHQELLDIEIIEVKMITEYYEKIFG